MSHGFRRLVVLGGSAWAVLGIVAFFVSTRSDLPIVATAIAAPLTWILMITGVWRVPRLLLGAAALFDLEAVLAGGLSPLLTGLPRQIVLEITEHVAIDDYDGLRRELKALGPTVLLAVDDAGAGYASFRHILELAPYFVEIDIDLVRSLNAEPARQALIAGMTISP